ncbi:uncharacterized protein [Asterias amurensis]
MMATNRMDTITVEATTKEDLDCSICLEHLKKPKILDCLHSFCAVCLQLYCEENNGLNDGKVQCPQCRQVTGLKGNGVNGLPDALELSAQVEEVTMQEQLLLVGQGSQIACQACDDEHHSTAWCTDCGHFICMECQRAHEKMAIMKSHQIYTLHQLQSDEIQYRSKLRDFTPKCQTHTQQTLSYHCYTCQKFVCVLCIVLTCNNQTPKHALVDLHQAADSCKLEVDQLVAECEKCKEKLQADLDDIEQTKRKLQSQLDKSKNKISKDIELEIAKLKNSEAKQIEKLDKSYKDEVDILKLSLVKCEVEVVHTEEQIHLVKQRMAHSTNFEVVNLKHKLLQNLQMLKGKKPQRKPDVENNKIFVLGSVEEIVTQPVTTKVPQRKPDVETDKISIVESVEKQLASQISRVHVRSTSLRPAAASSTEIVMQPVTTKVPQRKPDVETDKISIVESVEKQLASQISRVHVRSTSLRPAAASSTEPSQQWNLQAQILSKPSYEFYDIAALSNNVVVLADIHHRGFTITDSKPQSSVPHNRLEIKDLSICPRHLSVDEHDKIYVLDDVGVKVVSKNGQLLSQFSAITYNRKKPSCLAVGGDLIAVGYYHGRKLSLYNKDTTLIKTIYAPMINEYLTIHKKTFIYTSWVNKKLLSVDYYGDLVYSVDIGDDSSPNGVCCHSDGTVYVAVWKGNSGGIQQYSPDGQYIGYINKECSHPRGITLTQCGEMIVAEGMSASRLKPKKK